MRFLWVVAVAACNQVYGLDETKVGDVDGDVDGDGVLDSVDNCPSIGNPNQEDVDGDGKGEACALLCMPGAGTRTNKDYDRDRVDDGCDPCPRSPQTDSLGRVLDEDGDGDYDACDNCPGTPNPDQANPDADELGEACDASTGFGARMLFDPFFRKQPFWSTGWEIKDGTATSNPASGADMVLVGVEVAFQSWSIETGIELPASGTIGLDLVRNSDQTKHGCILKHGPTGWQLIAHSALALTTVDVPAASGLVRLRSTINLVVTNPRITCHAAGVQTGITAPSGTPSFTIRIAADVATKFTYVDIAN